MTTNTLEVIDRGIRCLSENIGAQDTEIFITTMLRERFDYTKWRQSLMDRIDTFEKLDKAAEDAKGVTDFGGNPKVIL